MLHKFILPVLVNNISFADMAKCRISKFFYKTSARRGETRQVKLSQVKFICIAYFMYKTIQSALHKIKALQRGAEKALKICKII